MAIKRVSNLDFLTTDELKKISLLDSTNIIKNNNLKDKRNDGKSHILFECSYPTSNTAGENQELTSNIYNSKKLTYHALLSNAILPDTKKYLNESNALLDKNNNDFKISSIVYDDYEFTGDKTFNGNVNVTGNISGQTITIGTTTTENINVSQIDTRPDDKQGQTITKYHFLASPHGYFSEIRAYNDNSYELTSSQSLGEIAVNATDIRLNHGNNSKVFITNNLCVGSTDYVNIASGSLTATGNVTISSNLAIGGIVNTNLIVGTQSQQKNTTLNGELTVLNNTRINESLTVDNQIKSNTLIVGNSDSCGGCTETLLNEGDIRCNNVYGIAHHARWSDLAENYLTDKKYEPGTLIKFGGEKEVTIADTEVNGVISTKPGYILNSELIDGQPIALAGRVQIRIKGKVKKFDLIYLSDEPGIGIASNQFNNIPIGKALENKENNSINLVECVTKFKF